MKVHITAKLLIGARLSVRRISQVNFVVGVLATHNQAKSVIESICSSYIALLLNKLALKDLVLVMKFKHLLVKFFKCIVEHV